MRDQANTWNNLLAELRKAPGLFASQPFFELAPPPLFLLALGLLFFLQNTELSQV
jgi:hypothetical protein